MNQKAILDKNIEITAKKLQEFYDGACPDYAITLGSGLAGVEEILQNRKTLSYSDLPAFPDTGVKGHKSEIVLGTIEKQKILFITGRVHYYEKQDPIGMKGLIRSLAKSGIKNMILTNAAGAINPDIPAGSLVALTDHVSFTGISPLFFEDSNDRFVDMNNAYSPLITEQLLKAAKKVNAPLYKGVYAWFCGPHFETPAEIKAAHILGCDVVGMSTAPEVILARHSKIECAAISIIANAAAGMSNEKLSHQHTLDQVKLAKNHLIELLKEFFTSASA